MEVMKKGHEVLKNPLSLATWMLDPEAYPGSKVLSGCLSAPGTACPSTVLCLPRCWQPAS